MKIAILTPTFSYHSGIDRVVQQQAEDYARKGSKVTVIALEADIKPKNYSVEILGTPKNQLLQRLHRLLFFLDFGKMQYYKKLADYDLVISHFYPMNWLAYKAKKHFKVKYFYFNHGINTEELGSPLQKVYMKLFSFFNNITLKNVDEAFSVSKYVQQSLKKESGMDSKVVYNKIDTQKFNPKVSGDKIRKKYNIQSKKVLLYVGRIAPHKGIHLLIEAFKVIKSKIPDAVLLIVGKPTFSNYFNKLKKTAGDGVVFAGFVADKDLPNYYAACDVYATASLWEGFDLPAAEAQACGKRVVAFNIGSHPEIVKNGILVEKANAENFSNAVIKLLSL
ncbi:MAG: glycosyltransferase family 4 protein [Nanoarchaeota archaeon]